MSFYSKRVVGNSRRAFLIPTHFFRFRCRLRFRTGGELSPVTVTRRGRPVLFAFLLIAPTAWAAEAEPAAGSPLTLESAVSLAVKDNPDLAEMHARSEALAAIPSQVGTLPDPVLSFNALNLPTDTFDTSQEAMTQLQLGVSQVIPFPGKLGLKEDVAGFEAEAASNDVDETRLRLVRDVKIGWWLLFYLDQALQIIRSNQDLLRQFVEIAQIKYKVGDGLQQDVLLAQLELSKLLDQELKLVGMRRVEAARLNALLARPADRTVDLPRKIDEQLPDIIAESVLYRKAEVSSPLLARQRSTIHAAQARLDLAMKDYYPDFSVGAFYGFRSGDNPLPRTGTRADFLSLKLSMTVPLFAYRKQAKAVDQRNSELLQHNYALRNEWDQVRARISSALADYQRAREQSVLFKTGIVPQARQTVASMLAGYQVNKVDFLNLVGSQITLYNYETRYWRVLSEANQALARLIAVIGEEEIIGKEGIDE